MAIPLSPKLPPRELGATMQFTLAQCRETREELQLVMERMRAALCSAQSGLEGARRDLKSVTAYVQAVKDR